MCCILAMGPHVDAQMAHARACMCTDAEQLSAAANVKWHGGSMQTPFHWGMEDMSSASAKPCGITSIPPSPFSPDAGALRMSILCIFCKTCCEQSATDSHSDLLNFCR